MTGSGSFQSKSVVELLTHLARSLVDGTRATGVTTLLFSPSSGEVEFVVRRGLSLEICGALTSKGGRKLLSQARRSPRSHLLRRTALSAPSPELSTALGGEGLGGVALFPILESEAVLGYVVVGLPGDSQEASAVAERTAIRWEAAGRWLGALREEAGRAALRSLLAFHHEGQARSVQALLVLDHEERILFSHGVSRYLPAWGRGEVMGQPLKGLPGGRILASMECNGASHLVWRTRKLTAGERELSLNLTAFSAAPKEGGRGLWRVILVREGENPAEGADGGILLELALRLSATEGMTEGGEREVEALAQGAITAAEKVNEEEPIDLTGLFRGLLRRLEPELIDDRIRVLPFLQGDLPLVRGDRRLLETALWAVLQKVWGALLPQGGTITLRTWEEAGSIWCTLADDGKGTEDWAALEELSEGSVPLDSASGGLPTSGVEMARELIRAGGGTLHVEHRPQLWTRYSVVFAAERVVKAPAARGIPPAVEVRKTGDGEMAVLVVDDNRMVRTVLRKYLERRGHEVTEAVDGAVALEILQDRAFDRVMVDIDMPGTTGVEFFQQLDSVNPIMRERTVFMTGGFQGGEAEEFIQGTGRPHLQKPFDLEQIREILRA
jgi:CheY-like chemotaxis protein